jgi:hypothetical protein
MQQIATLWQPYREKITVDKNDPVYDLVVTGFPSALRPHVASQTTTLIEGRLTQAILLRHRGLRSSIIASRRVRQQATEAILKFKFEERMSRQNPDDHGAIKPRIARAIRFTHAASTKAARQFCTVRPSLPLPGSFLV